MNTSSIRNLAKKEIETLKAKGFSLKSIRDAFRDGAFLASEGYEDELLVEEIDHILTQELKA